ncbi:MAG: response regulator [Planctomycetes bacterium]|nr:response regulator [Planctomycetota bacterium]
MPTFDDSDISRLPGLLVVDPDARQRVDLSREMKKHGWQVWVAGNSADAIKIYEELRHRIDIVLVDLLLPGLQGGSLLAEFAELAPHLIRCAMTGEVSPYAVAAFRRMSDTPLFTKPLSVRSLAFTLHEMIAPMSRYSDADEVSRRGGVAVV